MNLIKRLKRIERQYGPPTPAVCVIFMLDTTETEAQARARCNAPDDAPVVFIKRSDVAYPDES